MFLHLNITKANVCGRVCSVQMLCVCVCVCMCVCTRVHVFVCDLFCLSIKVFRVKGGGRSVGNISICISLIHIIVKNNMAHDWAIRERARAKLCAGQAH